MITIVNPLLTSIAFTGDAHLAGTTPCSSFYLTTGATRQKSYLLKYGFEDQEFVNDDPQILQSLKLYIFDLESDISEISAITGLTKVFSFYNLSPNTFFFSSALRRLFILSNLTSFLATSVKVTFTSVTEEGFDAVYNPTVTNGVIVMVNSGDVGCINATTSIDSTTGAISIVSPVQMEPSNTLSINIQISFQGVNANQIVDCQWCEYAIAIDLSEIASIEFQNRVYTPYYQQIDTFIYTAKFFVNTLQNKILLLNY